MFPAQTAKRSRHRRKSVSHCWYYISGNTKTVNMTPMPTRVAILLASAILIHAAPGLDPARLARVPVRMKQFVDAGQAAGIVTLVARHGQIAALDAVGFTDLETRDQPMKVDNIFQIHSMTKPIVCLAALLLAEE